VVPVMATQTLPIRERRWEFRLGNLSLSS
jgi:hypothetical protein